MVPPFSGGDVILPINGGAYEKLTLDVPTMPSTIISICKPLPDPPEDDALIHVLFMICASHSVPPTFNWMVDVEAPKYSP